MMDKKRITELSEDIREHVFYVLDCEPELTGDEAGRIAQVIQDAFLDEMLSEDAIDTRRGE